MPLTIVPGLKEPYFPPPQTGFACGATGQVILAAAQLFGLSFHRSRSSGRLPDTLGPSLRSSSRNCRTLVTSKFCARLCSPVAVYTTPGEAGNCQDFACEAAPARGEKHDFRAASFLQGGCANNPAADFVWLGNWHAPYMRAESAREIDTANFVLGARNWHSEFRVWLLLAWA